jgi:hypothetical protein
MSDQSEIEQMVNERECIHRNEQTEGRFYAATTYVKALQRLSGSAAVEMARKVDSFFWSDAPKIKVWLCTDCAAEIGLKPEL